MSSSEDSPIKEGPSAEGRGKRRMRESLCKKKLFAVDGESNLDSAW